MAKIIMSLFMKLFHMSISASYLILAVLLVRFLLRKAPKRMRSFLWLLVGIRLIFPFSIESIFSLIPDSKVVDTYLYEMEQPVDNITAATAVKKPASHPLQNIDVSAAEMDRWTPQAAWMFCAKVWIAGSALMLGYMLFSYLRLKSRVRMSVPTDVIIDYDNMNEKHNSVKIYQSDAIESPFLFGILHPRIYIPCCISCDEIPYVIRHELTHKRRKDYLIKPLGFLILSVYWFNPCVWAAYIMLCKDIELICDEYVVRELGSEYKKAYSQALLNSAVNHRMIAACPIAFGEVSVKERVKNVLNYKKPAFWLLAAAVLACVIVPVCFMTQKKTDASLQADTQKGNAAAQTELQKKDTPVQMDAQKENSVDLIAGEYVMFLPEPEQEESVYDDVYSFTPRLSLGKDGEFSFGYDPFSSYLIFGTYDIASDCVKAVTYDGKYHYQFTHIGHGLLRFDAEESSELHKTNTDVAASIENGSIFVKDEVLLQEQADALKLPAAAKTIEQWAIAFCDRDAKTIQKLASDDVKRQFIEQDLLVSGVDGEGDPASFGWSSPWPWGDMYYIVSATEHAAEILYYAWVSDPHVTVWRELLTYNMEDGTCVITSESLQHMDGICIAEEFHHAYPNGITETM
ncbi:MAG: M56 family metallopeptidase, partial [Lachnospiraceae bacterium]|nr:M56 family metallopeptidase [Lachnospiraceae bacterium]